jgi:hypothetical protein
MSDPTNEILHAVLEIRDLLQIMAEPALTERDKRLRAELRRIVGRSLPASKAVLLMDGSHTQRAIHRDTGFNEGNLSTLVKRLAAAKLISGDGKMPKLSISLPPDFFDTDPDR